MYSFSLKYENHTFHQVRPLHTENQILHQESGSLKGGQTVSNMFWSNILSEFSLFSFYTAPIRTISFTYTRLKCANDKKFPTHMFPTLIFQTKINCDIWKFVDSTRTLLEIHGYKKLIYGTHFQMVVPSVWY